MRLQFWILDFGFGRSRSFSGKGNHNSPALEGGGRGAGGAHEEVGTDWRRVAGMQHGDVVRPTHPLAPSLSGRGNT
jgi:hypothetical protein